MTSLQQGPPPAALVPAGGGKSGAGARGASRGAARAGRLLTQIAGVAVAGLIWHLFAHGPGRHVELPTPVQVLGRLAELAGTAEYWQAIGGTLLTAVIGLALSILIGVPVGLFNGSDKRVAMSSQFVIDFMRTIPPVAVMPLLLLVLGGTTSMALVLIMLGAVWPLIVQSTYAMQQVSPQLKMVGTAFHLTRRERIRSIYVPSALPFLMAGVRVAAVLSLLLAVVAEFFGSVEGVGRGLSRTLESNDSVAMFVYSATTALMGMLLNAVILLGQRRLLRWHPSVRKAR
ncbi:ABC transporter permease [Actinomadura sp. LOL_016]|uniref:ABC transporter permease n=1 Tax=unclassified Actinomadura TaxID=2626254 RepID=UPI003A801422